VFSAIVFAFAWALSTYQTVNSVLFLLFLLGEILAKECLNEFSYNPTLPNPYSLYNQDRKEEPRLGIERSGVLTLSLSS